MSVAASGDVDGDGTQDILVGAPGQGPNFHGVVHVISGATGTVLRKHTSSGSRSLGRSVAGVGDLDHDGHADYAAGAPSQSSTGYKKQEGAVYVFSGKTGQQLALLLGPAIHTHFGISVAGAHDVDADGTDDLVIGGYGALGPGHRNGAAWVYSGFDFQPIRHVRGDPGLELLGAAVAGGGDVDADGRPDVLVGAPWLDDGRVLVLSGGDGLGTNYCSPAVPNSTGAPGRLSANGSPYVRRADVHLSAAGLPPQQFGFFLASPTQDFVAQAGGSQGNLCLGAPLGRFADRLRWTGDAGVFGLRVPLQQMPPPHQAVLPGETWNFQAWYRDVNPTPTSNFTDAVAILFTPDAHGEF